MASNEPMALLATVSRSVQLVLPSLSHTDWAMAAAMLAANTTEDAPIKALAPNFLIVRALLMVLLVKVSLWLASRLGTLMVMAPKLAESSKRAPMALTAFPNTPSGVVGEVAAPNTAPIDLT